MAVDDFALLEVLFDVAGADDVAGVVQLSGESVEVCVDALRFPTGVCEDGAVGFACRRLGAGGSLPGPA